MTASPYDPPTVAEFPADESRPIKPWGMISLLLCGLNCLLVMGFFGAALFMSARVLTQAGQTPQAAATSVASFGISFLLIMLLGMASWIASVIFGILGLKTGGKGRVMSIISLSVNVLTVLGFVGLMLIGSLLG